MKVVLLLACTWTILTSRNVQATAIRAPLEIISLDDITPEERKELDHLQHSEDRSKRSESGDILESLKTAIGQGIKKKIGQIAQGSASASARLSSSGSGSSSGHGYSYPSHHYPEHEGHDHKSFDFWSLKKSILNTLLQAVKAIKGGVIAVKGQLIKGGGHLISAKGKLISAKGEAITKLGKNIATSAVLVPYHGHSSSGYTEYGPPSDFHHSSPSAPEDIYHGSHSAPGPEYHEPPAHYSSYHDDDTSHGGHAGLLILKKIPKDYHHHHADEESKVPVFKPIEPSGPGFGTIIGKFLSASSSLDPHKPDLFGHTADGNDGLYHSESHHHPKQVHPVSYKNKNTVEPGASGYVVDDDPPKKEAGNKPSTSYGTPFEKEPSYLNQGFDEYKASASVNNPQTLKVNSISTQVLKEPSKKPSSNLELLNPTSSQSFDYPTITAESLSSPSSFTFLQGNYNVPSSSLGDIPNISDYPNGFPNTILFPQSSKGELPASLLDQSSTIDLTNLYSPPGAGDITSTNYVGPQSFPSEDSEPEKPISDPSPYLQTPKQSYFLPTPFNSNGDASPTKVSYLDSFPSSSKYKFRSRPPSPKRPSSSKRPGSTRTTTKHKPKHAYEVVRSVGYELGPNGPKRLT